MPILAQEPDLFPPNLLDDDGPGSKDCWYAMYTLSRHEKELMRKLRNLGIWHYGPMISQRHRSPQGRIRTSYVPLFTGYVFVCGSGEHRYEAVSTGCVSRCLEVSEPLELREDLRRIRRLLEFGQDVRPEPKPLIGRLAVIRSGAMVGLKGTITRVDKQHRLTILVNFMQQGASVLVDEADIELLD